MFTNKILALSLAVCLLPAFAPLAVADTMSGDSTLSSPVSAPDAPADAAGADRMMAPAGESEAPPPMPQETEGDN